MSVTPEQMERRRIERRINGRLGDLTIPELRRILITTMLFVVVLALFLWMVRTVIIAAILAIVIALYLRPMYGWLAERTGKRVAALLSLALFIVPVLGLLLYSYLEIAGVARYTAANQEVIASRIDESLRRLPFLASIDTKETVRRWVTLASNSGLAIPGMVREALADFSVAATIFAFTVFYVLVDAAKISAYLRSKVPPRYDELTRALETNARGVLYGAIYSTFLQRGFDHQPRSAGA